MLHKPAGTHSALIQIFSLHLIEVAIKCHVYGFSEADHDIIDVPVCKAVLLVMGPAIFEPSIAVQEHGNPA